MLIKVDLDNSFLGRSIAGVTGHPGCYSEGRDATEAILRVPQTLIAYQQWIGKHTRQSWLEDLGDFDVRLVQALDSSDEGSTNWFESDVLPLNGVEVSRGLQVLAWSHSDLLHLVNSLSESELERVIEGETRSIHDILAHMSKIELSVLDIPGLEEIGEVNPSGGVMERLEEARKKFSRALPALAGVEKTWDVDRERWSGRKLLRRAAWHERDHIQQILRIMTRF